MVSIPSKQTKYHLPHQANSSIYFQKGEENLWLQKGNTSVNFLMFYTQLTHVNINVKIRSPQDYRLFKRITFIIPLRTMYIRSMCSGVTIFFIQKWIHVGDAPCFKTDNDAYTNPIQIALLFNYAFINCICKQTESIRGRLPRVSTIRGFTRTTFIPISDTNIIYLVSCILPLGQPIDPLM